MLWHSRILRDELHNWVMSTNTKVENEDDELLYTHYVLYAVWSLNSLRMCKLKIIMHNY